MRKKIICALALLILLLLMSSCGCKHDWLEANCENPRQCVLCGEIEGNPLGHHFSYATCTHPRTCSRCEKTEGAVLEHSFSEATCLKPKLCRSCGLTEGDVSPHDFGEWTESGAVVERSCSFCGLTESEDKQDYLSRNFVVGTWVATVVEFYYSDGTKSHQLTGDEAIFVFYSDGTYERDGSMFSYESGLWFSEYSEVADYVYTLSGDMVLVSAEIFGRDDQLCVVKQYDGYSGAVFFSKVE